METIIATPHPVNLGASLLRARATGALVCGAFGGGWMFLGLRTGGIDTHTWFAATALCAAGFVLWPVTRLFSLRHLPSTPAGRKLWPSVSKAFWGIVAIELLALNLATSWLRQNGHANLIPQLMGVVVGLHFLPLAKIFKAPIYYWTGTAMTLGVLVSLAVPAEHLRTIVACSLSGVSLWATSTAILCQDKIFFPAKEQAG